MKEEKLSLQEQAESRKRENESAKKRLRKVLTKDLCVCGHTHNMHDPDRHNRCDSCDYIFGRQCDGYREVQ